METLLLTIGFIGIIILILTPLNKTGSVIAVGSLFGYFYYTQADSWMPIILFIVGLVLIVLEAFVPDFGLLGLLGASSMALGIYYTTGDFGIMVRDLSIAVIASVILIIILIRNGYSISNFNQIVLKTSSQKTTEREETENKAQIKVGMVGKALTPLRPAGKAIFNDQTPSYDVLSTGGHISSGAKIVIQEIHGTKIVVREKK